QPDGVHVHGARSGEPRRDRVRLHLPATRRRRRRPCALLGTGEPRGAGRPSLARRQRLARVRLAVWQRRIRPARVAHDSVEWQLRIYEIEDGELDAWIAEWREHVAPLRRRLGFRILGPW